MTCNGCGNKEATFCRSGFCRNEQGEREPYEYCDKCGDAGPVYVPDVFWDGKPEETLSNDPVTGKARVFLSKGQKAQYLREHGLYEAGDKFHGSSFTSIVSEDTTKSRRENLEKIREVRAKVASMGKDFRRQEVLRIAQEARKYA